MCKNHFFFSLRPHENVAIVTVDGEMKKALVHKQSDMLDHADAIQGIMIDIMKSPFAKDGAWIWKISENWSAVLGWEIDL